MLEEQKKIDVYESRWFEKAISKLSEALLKTVEDEIDEIIKNPKIGEQKKGDLAYLRVHKFKLSNQLARLGYSWVETKLEIYLLQLGSHENFYKKIKDQRKIDRKLIDS
ncbi:type II toxin-antitoxin system RelE/ParE family toxin [Marinospirillum minutulum]|uniref:type II toxin-antitoxin system RelE/ParE family toxin n=1 Tax=Marinospirillum minutulum TaxID=64974 RepID=UPI0003FC2FA5|nr:type II toxin-antitoxin system RelE/ParE family toxin [Marinospirillum minutulum]